jgi:hypothetical protein
MKRSISLATIQAAELRVAQSRCNTRDSLHRARSASGSALTRASTLAPYAGATGLLVSWFLLRRLKRASTSSMDGAGAATQASASNRAREFILRHWSPVFAFLLHQGAATWLKRCTQFSVDESGSSAAGNSANA